jgi:hypothetical protein
MCSKREVPTGFWRGNLKQNKHFENLEVDAVKILKFVFKEYGGGREVSGSGL